MNSPWFDDLYIKLNTFEVKERERSQMRNYERMADQMIDELQKPVSVVQKVVPVSAEKDTWTCACGASNTGKFCSECGAKRPQSVAHCTNCGWSAPDASLSPKFCPECGKPIK